MKILSIFWNGISTAALMVEGEIVACVSEERFSRIKNEDSYPLKAIESVLKIAGVDPEELDWVVIPGERFDATSNLCHKMSNFSASDRLREQHQYWYPRLIQNKEVSFLEVFQDKIDIEQYPGKWDDVIEIIRSGNQEKSNNFFQNWRRNVVSKHLGIAPNKIRFIPHHTAHAFYAYYGSPVRKDRAVILTADAWGDDMNASVSLAEGSKITLLHSSTNFIIGRLYRYITLLLGMKPDEHEYKVMGLAAYAKPQYFQDILDIFQNTMFVEGLGFDYRTIPSDLYFYFRDLLEAKRFDNIAGAIQQYTENILVKWAKNTMQYTNAHVLCFGGGVGMNIKAMMEISNLDDVEDMVMLPSTSDESLAIGAAYVAMHEICISQGGDPIEVLKPLQNAYLGPEGTEAAVRKVADNAAIKGYRILQSPDNAYIAHLISEGKVLGRCVGRSEFGARALGNRSIIGDPRRTSVIKTINEKVKSRDFWMPFAPTILAEHADQYLVNPKGLQAPYMTIGFKTKPPAWRDIIAGLHQADLSARPQILTKEANPAYYDLVKTFSEITGVGGVLNTSFNVHGEPIVQTPEDAFDVFERSELDALLLEECLIERNKD
jgi:carbamoyltransferase